MNDETDGFYDGDGTKIYPELVPKPGLCITCKKDDLGKNEEIVCILTGNDQRIEDEFKCDACEPKFK